LAAVLALLATLMAIGYGQFKVTFSAEMGGYWDDPLGNLGRPVITNLLMDPFGRQWGDLNRLSPQFGKTIEDIQSQLLKIQHAN